VTVTKRYSIAALVVTGCALEIAALSGADVLMSAADVVGCAMILSDGAGKWRNRFKKSKKQKNKTKKYKNQKTFLFNTMLRKIEIYSHVFIWCDAIQA
jgi:arginine exporter protein ArgO